jgi:hypothetical protein
MLGCTSLGIWHNLLVNILFFLPFAEVVAAYIGKSISVLSVFK